MRSLNDVYSKIVKSYDGEINDQKLIEGATKGLVAGLGDQHTNYLTIDETKEFNEQLSGEIGGGIGAEIGMREGWPTIVKPLKGNPAEKAGLLKDDVIMKVDGEDVAGKELEVVIKKVRGEAGKKVKLTIARKGWTEPKDIEVTREIVNNPSVSTEIKDGIGIITLTRFDQKSGSLVRKSAYELKQSGVKGIVLDLRDNSGGYLTAAQEIASLWLNNEVVVIEKQGKEVKEELKTSSGYAEFENIPTVVLINNSSASASEILAGALKDYSKAKIVGEKSYGKGSVQELINMPKGGTLKLTIAHWFTPKGNTIHKVGIVPDIEVKRSVEDYKNNIDPQMDRALQELSK